MEDVGTMALTDSQQDQITEQWQDVYDRACQSLSLSGFDPMNTPEACPYPDITPADYINLEGEAYTKTMATVDYWFGRAKERLSWVEAELLCREAELKDVVRGIRNMLRDQSPTAKKSERPSETELKDKAEGFPYPRSLNQRITELRGAQVVLKGRVEALERFAAGLSRQVTLRQQEIEIHGAKGRQHPGHFSR